ncbi:UPI0003D1A1DD related cluster [groundwater metagenome]
MRIQHFAVLFIIFWCMSISSAAGFSPGDIEWGTAVSGTLYRGDTLANGEYMVKAAQFSSSVQGYKDINGNIVPETPVDPMVFLEIYKNGTLLKEIVMNPVSEAYIDPDYEVKVSVTGFLSKNAREWVSEYYKPRASLSIAKSARPKLEVKVTTDKDPYTSYSDLIITAKIEVKNSGAFAKNVDVNLNTGELKLRSGDVSDLHRYYQRMEKDTSQSFEVILLVPGLLDQRSYNLSAVAKGYDAKDLEYSANTSTSVKISPQQNYFTLSKSVKDRIYLQNAALVTITAANGGRYEIFNIHLNDSMNENFELASGTLLQWDIPLLRPGEEWSTSYSIRPLEANLNGFAIPAATAIFTVNNKPYSASSKTTTLVVNGPKIIVNKTVNKNPVNISEDVMVSVSLINVGNTATRVEMKDSLPESVNLVSGRTSLSPVFLELNAPQGFSYIIRRDAEGEVQLPPAVANYTDVEYRGLTRSQIRSNMPIITFIDPSKVTPTPTASATSTFIAAPEQKNTEIPQPATTPASTPYTPGLGSLWLSSCCYLPQLLNEDDFFYSVFKDDLNI